MNGGAFSSWVAFAVWVGLCLVECYKLERLDEQLKWLRAERVKLQDAVADLPTVVEVEK